MIHIQLKDGSILDFEESTPAFEVAKKLGMGLYKAACAVKVDGEVQDLRIPLDKDCTLEILTFNDEEGRRAYRHTASHVLAQAVKRLYPSTKLAIGPAIDTGFYYDFEPEKPFTQEDLPKIEAEMKKIIKEGFEPERYTLSKEEALAWAESAGEPYKTELIQELPQGETISFYRQGEFTDLCAGPHLMNVKTLKAIKLTAIAGAYWRGDEKNKMLVRIYGTAFTKQADLEAYLEAVEDAKKRDHNKLGRDLKLFTTSEVIGQGLPLLMPKGAKVVQLLQRFVEDEEEKRGYVLTKTPLFAKSDLYKMSGHWSHYKDGMFIIGDEEKEEDLFALRPMTCPFQFTIYNAEQHSYRDLPIRYAETSTLFRNEASGEMHGLIRVRQFTISEGHLVCTKEQLSSEFKGVVDLINYMMNTLGIQDDITYRFSKWDPNNKDKYEGAPEIWEESQNIMRTLLNELGIPFTEEEGEAAFYGPKLDIQFKNVHGKEDTIITVQLDFSLAERFNMTYVDADGTKKHPIIIHRTSIGCYERTLAMLIEKYAGAFPLWLAPTQVKVLPISDKFWDYASQVANALKEADIRVEVDDRSEKIGYKIREAQMQKIPYFLVVGEKEQTEGNISVRRRNSQETGVYTLEDFTAQLKEEIASKKI